MAATFGFPFTNAQWKELERQAMIYKYMVASVPVPHDLLLPINTRNFSAPVAASQYPCKYFFFLLLQFQLLNLVLIGFAVMTIKCLMIGFVNFVLFWWACSGK